MGTTRLTEAQKRELTRNGFLVLDSPVDRDLIDSARESILADETITEGNQNQPEATTETFREINRQLFAYADELVGGDRIKHPDDENWGGYAGEQARVAPRTPGEDWITDPYTDRLDGIHVDDQTDGEGSLFALGAGIYLDRVQPRNGGFTVWPGSHWMVAAHCELEDPNEDAPPGTRERAPSVRIRDDSEFDSQTELYESVKPFEITGDAGSVVLWHGQLVHAAGVNFSPGSVRLAAFSRFYLTPDNWGSMAIEEPFGYWDGISGEESDSSYWNRT